MSPERGNAGIAPESICMFIIRKAIDLDAVGLVSIILFYFLDQKDGSEVILSSPILAVFSVVQFNIRETPKKVFSISI